MTVLEAKEKYGDENGYVNCFKCPLNALNPMCTRKYADQTACNGYDVAYEAIANYMTEQETATNTQDPTDTVDMVNHPPHYCQGGMECIDEMVLIFGKEAVKNFCLCNAWKYRKRALFKNKEEDIKKSDWYIQKYKELSTNE